MAWGLQAGVRIPFQARHLVSQSFVALVNRPGLALGACAGPTQPRPQRAEERGQAAQRAIFFNVFFN